ncbi:MAG: hypothetical protein C9356_15830 [Oleiphilus sp.]|nr:MAG: hypothetical protein C9356_15830 [Oleiphilus sp.]
MLGSFGLVLDRFQHYHLDRRPIAIVGAGYSGKALANALVDQGYRVNLFDIRQVSEETTKENLNLFVDRFEEIGSSGLIIILSTDGESGFRSIKRHLKPNMVVLSNAFPSLSPESVAIMKSSGVFVFETFASIPSTRTFPNLKGLVPPGFGGCYIQAHLESITGTHYDNDIARFTQDANEHNIKPFLVPL